MESPTATRPRLAETFFDSLRQMACINGYQGQFLAVNAAFSAALGWTESELKDIAYYDLVSLPDRKSLIKLGTLIIRHAGGEPRTYRRNFRHRDGTYRLVEWSAWADPQAKVVFTTGRVFVATVAEPRR